MVITKQVVLLNADYSFLNTVSWQKAMCLITKGKAEVVKYTNAIIRTGEGVIMKIPYVMRLIKFIRTLYKTRVPYSKKNIMIRDGMRCMYCGSGDKRLTIDHIVPKSKGGKSTFENCIASCKPCNNKKGDKTCSEARMFPRVMPTQPTISEFLMLRMRKLGIDSIIQECFE